MIVLLIITYITYIGLGLPDSLLGAAWPAVYTELGVPISWAGILSVTIASGTIISSFFSGKITRRFGTGKTTAVSVALTALALFGFSITSSFWTMFIFAVPLGFGGGCVDAALNYYVALHYKAKHMNWLHSFWGVGTTISPLIVSRCINAGGWKFGYSTVGWIQTAIVLTILISLPLWKKYEKMPKHQDSSEKAFTTREIIKIPGAKAAMSTFLIYCALETTAGLWGSSFLVLSKGIPAEKAASWISLFYLGITVGRIISGILTMKVSNRRLVNTGLAIIVFGILLLLIPTESFILGISFFVIGFGCAPIYPSTIHDTPKNFGEEASRSMMGIQMAFSYIGITAVPPIFGFLGENITMSIFPYFLLVFAAALVYSLKRLNSASKKHQ